jgi:type VI protein secretion system component Hcp
MAMRQSLGARPLATFLAPVLILATMMVAGAALAQKPSNSGYMRVLTASGHVMAGESTDPAHNGWIPLRQTTMPSVTQMAAMAQEDAAAGGAKAVHPPIVVVKDRDNSSLALLGAYSSHQHFPEIDIAVTDYSDQPAKKYKLTDAMIVSVRAAGVGDGTGETVEQLRISYLKIEVQP